MQVKFLSPLDMEAEVVLSPDKDGTCILDVRPKCYSKHTTSQTVMNLQTVDHNGKVHDTCRIMVNLKTGKIIKKPIKSKVEAKEILCPLDANNPKKSNAGSK